MADEEATNDQQPNDAASKQPEGEEATASEPAPGSSDKEDSGADVAPSAAEQLAADALSAARNAVASLDEDTAAGEQSAQSEPAAPASVSESPASASNGTGPLTGSMMGSGATSQPMPFTPEQLTQLASIQGGEGIDILSDVNLNVKIELGKTKMLVEDVLKLTDGAVVELDKLAGDPVDIYVNERHVARGEVLILNDNFCVRVSEILEATIEER